MRREPFIVRLAAQMELSSAIPRLLQRLECDEIPRREDLALALVTTLAQLGSDQVVNSLAETWKSGHRWAHDARRYRLLVCEILERMRSDRCIEFLRDRIADGAEQPLVRIWLGHALLAQFDTGAVSAVRQVIRKTETARYACRLDLYYHLLAACRIMHETFPKFEERYKKALAASWGWEEENPRLADDYFDPGPWPDHLE